MSEQNPEPQTDPNEPENEPQNPFAGQNEPTQNPFAGPNAEAAKYRKERNAAREERDALRSRWDDRDRADIDKLAADRLADPGDLWLSSSLDKMRAEDGTLDVGKASQEIDALLKAKPHYAKPAAPTPVDLHQGQRHTVAPPEPPSFGAAAKKALGGE